MGLAIVLGAAFGIGLQDAWLPPSIGPRTEGIDYLFNMIHVILGVVFAGTGLFLAFCLFRFRADSRERASYRAGNVWLEFLWTATPAAILVFLALHQLPYWRANKEDHPLFMVTQDENADEFVPPFARAVAFQYGWRFEYPGRDRLFDTPDDLISENELIMPAEDEILMELVSEDVIHSFAINPLRLKQDIVPGLNPRIWFTVSEPGEWEINCMELCGWGHFRMSARLSVVSKNDFRNWVSEQYRTRGY
jgi:cytochrome c oxidase subunit 2